VDHKDKLSYSIRELEAASGLSKSKIYELLADGVLSAVNCHGKTLVTGDEYRRMLANCPPVEFRKRGGRAHERPG
jgi:hypothetical protein